MCTRLSGTRVGVGLTLKNVRPCTSTFIVTVDSGVGVRLTHMSSFLFIHIVSLLSILRNVGIDNTVNMHPMMTVGGH